MSDFIKVWLMHQEETHQNKKNKTTSFKATLHHVIFTLYTMVGESNGGNFFVNYTIV